MKELLEQIKALTAQMKEVATDKGTTEAERDAKLDKMSEDLKALQDAIDKQPVGRRFEGNLDDAGFNSRDKGIAAEVARKHDECYTLARILGVNPTSTKHYQRYFGEGGELAKAMDTTTATSGGNWTWTGYSSELIQRVMLELKVAALHPSVDMPTDPYKIPKRTSMSTAYLGVQNTDTTASNPGTGMLTLDAQSLRVHVPASYELEEDSIVPLLAGIQDDIVLALAYGLEDAVINGDTTASHQDADVTDAIDVRKAWKGYRKLALSGSKKDLGTFNITNLRGIRKAMGKYGVNPNQLAWVVSMSAYMSMLGLTEVITMEKYGANATVLTGELARLDNIPIVVSECVRQDLNASGVYDGTTTDNTIALLVRRDGFVIGNRREVMLEQDRNIKSGTIDMVASMRKAFADRYDATTEPIVGLGYNITT